LIEFTVKFSIGSGTKGFTDDAKTW